MRIAFHATLKPPDHPVPSGDRQVARTLLAALELAGHEVLVASTLRTWSRTPDEQSAMAAAAEAELPGVIERVRDFGAQAWLSYHCYYRAPDLLGPRVAAALGLGHLIVEPSLAGKRAGGPWAPGHEAARTAIGAAHALLCPSRDDLERVAEATSRGARLDVLPPALIQPEAMRGKVPCFGWRRGTRLLAVGMMREGDKLASYRLLGRALALIDNLEWTLVVAGDGPARAAVEAALPADRTQYLGTVAPEVMPFVQIQCHVAVWPGIGEAYGMALLEAQGAGLPVVAGRLRGIPDVVSGGILVRPDDPQALADGIAALLRDPARRDALGRIAKEATAREHSLGAMARRLDGALDWAARRSGTVAA